MNPMIPHDVDGYYEYNNPPSEFSRNAMVGPNYRQNNFPLPTGTYQKNLDRLVALALENEAWEREQMRQITTVYYPKQQKIVNYGIMDQNSFQNNNPQATNMELESLRNIEKLAMQLHNSTHQNTSTSHFEPQISNQKTRSLRRKQEYSVRQMHQRVTPPTSSPELDQNSFDQRAKVCEALMLINLNQISTDNVTIIFLGRMEQCTITGAHLTIDKLEKFAL